MEHIICIFGQYKHQPATAHIYKINDTRRGIGVNHGDNFHAITSKMSTSHEDN